MLRVVLFLVLLGAVVWAFFWLLDRRRHPSGPGDSPGGGRPAPRRPRGPDDDEDFLRELDRKRRRDQAKPPATPPPPPAPAPEAEDDSSTDGGPGKQTDENA